VLGVDSQGTDPMAAFAISVLAVASRETMPTLYQVSTDWTFNSATLFLPDDFYHPKLCITTWEQGKVVRRMDGDHGKNASTMSKWVQLKDGIPTEVIGIRTAAPSNPTLDENDADSGPPDPALRPQCNPILVSFDSHVSTISGRFSHSHWLDLCTLHAILELCYFLNPVLEFLLLLLVAWVL